MKFIIYTLATGLGSGYTPYAPGTAGSLLAVLIYFLFPLSPFIWTFIITLTFFTGVWASGYVEKEQGKDPGIVVIDEIAGQWLALIFLPRGLIIFASAFILFRIFDIFKPYPIHDIQKLKSGWGIMLDDVLAGIYTNIILQIIVVTGLLS